MDAMNARLQALVNPPAPGKAEAVSGQLRFRLGDKVMQIKNYEQVNNGDVGYITNITGPENEATVEIDFGDGRIMKYESDQLRMLDLGYASTVSGRPVQICHSEPTMRPRDHADACHRLHSNYPRKASAHHRW